MSEQYNEDISGLQNAGHINYTVVLIFQYFQCLHLICSKVTWILVNSGTQVQPQIILEPNYLPDYLFVSYDYAQILILWYINSKNCECCSDFCAFDIKDHLLYVSMLWEAEAYIDPCQHL